MKGDPDLIVDTASDMPIRILDMWPICKKMASDTDLPTTRLEYMYRCICVDEGPRKFYNTGEDVLALIAIIRRVIQVVE